MQAQRFVTQPWIAPLRNEDNLYVLVPEELDGGPEDKKTSEKSHGNRPVAYSAGSPLIRMHSGMLCTCIRIFFFLERNNQRFEKQ